MKNEIQIKEQIKKLKYREDEILADCEFWIVAANVEIGYEFKEELRDLQAKISALEWVLNEVTVERSEIEP